MFKLKELIFISLICGVVCSLITWVTTDNVYKNHYQIETESYTYNDILYVKQNEHYPEQFMIVSEALGIIYMSDNYIEVVRMKNELSAATPPHYEEIMKDEELLYYIRR